MFVFNVNIDANMAADYYGDEMYKASQTKLRCINTKYIFGYAIV